MNYKRLILALVVCAIGFLGFMTLSIPDKPPMPKITYQGESVRVLQGSYLWKTFFKGVEAEYPIPPELVANIPPTIVSPESNLKVTFDYEPNDIGVMLWTKTGSHDYNIDHKTVIMPEDKGIYVFEIKSKWNQGDSIYAFKIKVE